ncbi:MAG TPA: hypothetical protein VJ768_05170, partial [Anaerolineales bacterium]|nr:hypothetical protein [Anaerolineales bacterium]
MPDFLENFEFDRNSFLIGFILGILFWMLVGVLWPLLKRTWGNFTTTLDQSRSLASRGIDVHLANDTLQRLQKAHLASALFSLDEVRVEPRILIPPAGQYPGEEPAIQDIATATIAFMPDATEMAGIYRAPALTLAKMLAPGANIVLIGRAGAGKSFALADLACQISRKSPAVGDLVNLVPLYLHALDFLPEISDGQSVLSVITDAALSYASPRTARQLPGYLDNAFSIGRALLLLDGLDELPPEAFDRYVIFLRKLLSDFPSIRIVTTASPAYYGDLTLMGFAPVAIASWNGIQRSTFIHQWSQLWTAHVDSAVWAGESRQEESPGRTPGLAVDPLFVEGMLLNNQGTYTPLEFTALTWAAFAGDMLGNSPGEGIEAYIRRNIAEFPDARDPLEQLAANFLIRQSATLRKRDIGTDFSDPGAIEIDGAEPELELAAQTEGASQP